MKMPIHGNERPDRFLDGEVCSHLSQLHEFIISYGYCSELDNGKFINDRSDGYIYMVRGKLPFDEIKRNFEIPDFVLLEPAYGIFCKKCWCSIKEAT